MKSRNDNWKDLSRPQPRNGIRAVMSILLVILTGSWGFSAQVKGTGAGAWPTGGRVQPSISDGSAPFFLRAWGGPMTGDGEFIYVAGVAVDSSLNLYVADTGNNRIQKFNKKGKFIAKWGTGGSGDGELDGPFGIGVDTHSNVYVADTYNNRVQKFDSNGTFIAKWGGSGSGDGQFNQPWG